MRSALPNCKIDFTGGVGSLGAKTVAPAPAAGAPESAIAKWIRDSLHGRAEVREDGRVRAVSLARTGVTDSQLAVVARLGSLEALDLEATEIGDLGLGALARCSTLKRLKLDSTTVSDRGLVHLSGLRQLESLSLAGTLVRTLAPLPANLKELDLSSTNAGLDAMRQVAALRSLTRVDLAYTDLSNPASQDLLGELAPTLRVLDLTGADIEDRGIAAIAKLKGLEELLVNHGRFTEKGFASLASLVNLRRFEAVRTRITAASAATLQAWPKLERLNLDYTTFNDEGLKAISSLPLRELRLDSANITDAGVVPLSAMKSLKLVNLYHTLVSEDAHGRLVQALPDTKIIWDRDSKLPNRRGS